VSEDLKYPVGQFDKQATYSSSERAGFTRVLEETPANLRAAVAGLSESQLDTPYRPDGWTVRQVVHHVPDSHMNAYIRVKLALTEDKPIIKPYDETAWALLSDSRGSCEVSLALLEALHSRWVDLWRNLNESDWQRGFVHPEMLKSDQAKAAENPEWAQGFAADQFGVITLEQALGTYAWHSRHHVAHVTQLRARMNW
jgi:DinB superfamily